MLAVFHFTYRVTNHRALIQCEKYVWVFLILMQNCKDLTWRAAGNIC